MYGRGSPGFGPPVTPPIVKNLIIANLAVFVAQHLGNLGFMLEDLGAVRPHDVWSRSFLWQPLTYMWLHAHGSLMHVGFNMYALHQLGRIAANPTSPMARSSPVEGSGIGVAPNTMSPPDEMVRSMNGSRTLMNRSVAKS